MTVSLILAVLLFGFAAPQNTNGPEVGSEAPDFVLKDSKGKSFKLADFRGQAVVLEFIRSGGW
jgi:cytochrome oxidase Cu insertion factor (SCO1/SenC/PrrC family)